MSRRRKPISIISRLETATPFSNLDSTLLSSKDILNKATALRDKASKEAYDKYNASLYPANVINAPDVPDIQGNINQTNSSYTGTPSSYAGTKDEFTTNIYNSYYKAVRPKAASDEDAARQASFLAQKAAFETGYGKHVVNTHNYGGHRTKDKGWLAFNSMDDFTAKDVALLDKKWNNWRNSKTPEDFVNAITTNNGYGAYAPRHEYQGYINMNKRKLTKAGKQVRPKAWIGAAIGAATSILGSVLSNNSAKKQAEEQRRVREQQAAIERAEGLTQSLGLMQNAQKEYENRFRVQYAKGGKEKVNTDFEITDGGYAIPIGKNTFLLQGRSHDQVNETGQTGIGLNVYAKGGAAKHSQVEAETGEVVEKKPDELRVFSDNIGLNGYSFADLVQMGYNKDKLFKIQQSMNGDYGKRKLRNGGCASSPVGRIKARWGIIDLIKKGYNNLVDAYTRFDNATTLPSVKNAPNRVILPDGREVSLSTVSTGAPTIIPGRAGGFRVNDVRNAVAATRNLANNVRNAVRRATPKNTPKPAKAPKILTENTTIASRAKEAARPVSWANAKPQNLNANNYAGATAGRGQSFGRDIPEGSLNFGLIDRAKLAANNYKWPAVTVGGIGAVGGLAYVNKSTGDSYVPIQGVESNNLYPDTIKTTVPQQQEITRPAIQDSVQYIGSSARRSNLAPYGSIQIGATTPTLTAYTLPDYSKDIDTYFSIRNIKGAPTTSSTDNTTTATTVPTKNSVTTNNRTLASAGRPKSVTAQTNTPNVPDYSSQQYIDYIKSQPNYIGDQTNDVAKETVPHFTNPADRDLYEYMQDVQKNGTPSVTKKDVDNLTVNSNNKFGTVFKGADWAGLAADAVGSIASAIIQSDSANRELDPVPPVRVSPGKLITNWNIAPRLSLADRAKTMMFDDADETFSSASRYAKRNEINSLINSQKDSLWGEKTNKEVELGNQDTLNQQQVNAANVENYNRYLENLIATRNRRRLGQSAALQVGLSGLGDAVGNFLDQGKQRYADQQAMRYYTALLPENGREWLKRNKVDFLRRGGRIR